MANSTGAVRDRLDHRTASSVVAGVVGGFLATVTMTVYRLPIARSLPPTREFWERFGPSGGPQAGPVLSLVLHVAYGTAAGGVFGAAVARADPERGSEATREVTSLVLGAVYGLGLSVFGHRVLLERLLSMDLDADEVLVFHVGHLVYALTLGTWVGSRTERST